VSALQEQDDAVRWRLPVPGQVRIEWDDEDDEPPTRRPAPRRPVAAHVVPLARRGLTQAGREAQADALAQVLWERLRATAATPTGSGRSGRPATGEEGGGGQA